MKGLIAMACLCLAIACGTAACTADVEGRTGAIAERERERRGGCPLDAIEYDTPVCVPDCLECLRVTDRLSGTSWWLLKTAKGYIVLPIGGNEQ